MASVYLFSSGLRTKEIYNKTNIANWLKRAQLLFFWLDTPYFQERG